MADLADIDNPRWKLDLVMRGKASIDLLETYNDEAITTADENILNSTRSTDFLTPKSRMSERFRAQRPGTGANGAIRAGVRELGPAVYGGQLSRSSLNTPDCDDWHERGVAPGSAAIDAPLEDAWLLERLGSEFVVLANGWPHGDLVGMRVIDVALCENGSVLLDRYDLAPGSADLFRPDQYVAGRWKTPSAEVVTKACLKAHGRAQS